MWVTLVHWHPLNTFIVAHMIISSPSILPWTHMLLEDLKICTEEANPPI